jgi:hypothetical protein
VKRTKIPFSAGSFLNKYVAVFILPHPDFHSPHPAFDSFDLLDLIDPFDPFDPFDLFDFYHNH